MKYLGSISDDKDLVNKEYVDGLAIDTSLFNMILSPTGTLSLRYDSGELSNVTITPSDIGAVPKSRTINTKALSSDITLTASDVGAVPTSRTINSKALSSDITLSASDVGAVPTTRKVNNIALSSDITLSASDVGAVPTTRKVNNKTLSSDITLSASDVSALASADLYTRSSAGTVDWSADTANKVMAKSSIAFWNGAYSGTSSNLKYCYNGVMIGGSYISREGFNTNCTAKSVAANGGTITVTCTKTKSGWLPIGLAGIDVSTPTGLAIRRSFISASSSGSVTVTVELTNTTGSAISVTTSHVVACYIIWARVS